jgi:hypothetical protein
MVFTIKILAHEQKWKERIGDYRLIRKTLSLPLNYAEPANHGKP